MGRYVLKRLGYIFIVLLLISIFLFWLFRQMPGDPAFHHMQDRIVDMTPEQFELEMARINEMLGLDQGIVIQYFRWLAQSAQGNFGYSLVHRRPVLEVVRVPIFWTTVLSVTSLTISFLITIPLGIISAVKRGKLFDNTTLVVTMLGFSMPTFLVALLFIIIFAVWWGGLPIAGMQSVIVPEGQMAQLLDRIHHMILPVLTFVFVGLAGMTRYVRSAMCDALNEDYVRTARAKGLADKVVVYSHAFRNVLIPLITILAGTFMGIFSGSVVLETIFSWSGMGRIMLSSITEMDYAVVFAMSLFFTLVSLFSILVMDLIYGLADPRIKVAG